MAEHHIAKIVLDLFSQNTCKIDETKDIESPQFLMGKQLEKQFKLWEKRNRIYVNMNRRSTDWVLPKDFKKEDLTLMRTLLNEIIERFLNLDSLTL